PEVARVRQLLLARVPDLASDDVVAAGQLEPRAPPVERPAEVRDEDDERPLAGERARPAHRLAERRRPGATRRRLAAERLEQPDQADPSLARWMRACVRVAERHDA